MQQLFYGQAKSSETLIPKEEVFEAMEQDLLAFEQSYANFMIELAKILMFCRQYSELEINDKVFFRLYKIRKIQKFSKTPVFRSCYTSTFERLCTTYQAAIFLVFISDMIQTI